MGNKYTTQTVIDAIVEAKGNISHASRLLGCTRATVYSYIKRYATVAKAYNDINETTKDFVENKLMQAIAKNNLTAIIFYLKTKAKDRGYVEKQQVAHDGELEFRVTYGNDS